jgi:hypothetical protein
MSKKPSIDWDVAWLMGLSFVTANIIGLVIYWPGWY